MGFRHFEPTYKYKMKRKNTSNWIRVFVWLTLMAVLTLLAVGIWFCFSDRTSIASMKWLQLLQTLALFFFPPLLTAYFCCEQPLHWLHLDRGMRWQTMLFAILLMLCAIPGINLLSHLNQQLTLPSFLEPLEDLIRSQEEAANRLTEQFLQVNTIGGLLVNIGLMALLPAMAEELTFRGILQSLLNPPAFNDVSVPSKPLSTHIGNTQSLTDNAVSASSKSLSARTHIAIWATAIIFSFVHFQFYGFIPRMLMGAMFGYMLAWTGSLWVPMLMHFTNNAIAVLSYYIAYNYSLDADSFDSIGISSTLYLGILSLILVFAALLAYPRHRLCSQ